MDKDTALDAAYWINGIIEMLVEAETDDDVGEILVDAQHNFKSLHPLEKDVVFLTLLGKVVKTIREKE